MMARLALAGVLAAAAFARGSAQPAAPLVTVHAVVTSASGGPVPLLTGDDFELRVDDVARPVEEFVARIRPTVALLVDVSASVFTVPGTLEEAVACLVDGLEARDRLRVGAVARHLYLGPVRSDYKSARSDVQHALNPRVEHIVGPTPLWDALAFVASELAKEPGPSAILLVTDGRSTGNRLGIAEAAEHALGANVSINALVAGPPEHLTMVPQDGERSVVVRPAAPLSSLAALTGGVLHVVDARLPIDTLGAVFAQLRETYTLRFRGVADRRVHRIAVRVRRSGFDVRARQAYVADLPKTRP